MDTCKYKNCQFSCDKSLLGKADALIMHLTDVYAELLNNQVALGVLIAARRAEQPWILWNDEANNVNSRIDSMKFNWTLSYKAESEGSYGTYGCYESAQAGNIKKKNIDELFEKFVRENFERRQMGSVWFVSNCGSGSRNMFAVGISIYSKVNIY